MERITQRGGRDGDACGAPEWSSLVNGKTQTRSGGGVEAKWRRVE